MNSDSSNGENISENMKRLCNVRNKLIETYHRVFLQNLIEQVVNKPGRYKPVPHDLIKPGDIVLLVEQFSNIMSILWGGYKRWKQLSWVK